MYTHCYHVQCLTILPLSLYYDHIMQTNKYVSIKPFLKFECYHGTIDIVLVDSLISI